MKGLKELLLHEQERLETIIKKTKISLKDAPTGTLRLSRSHNKLQYYRCTDEKILKLAEIRLLQIQKITKDYNENEIEEIYFNEREERRQLITPIEPTWEQRVEEWRLREYKSKGFREDLGRLFLQKWN